MRSKDLLLTWLKHISFLIIGFLILLVLVNNSNFDSLNQLKDIKFKPLLIAFLLTIGITSIIAYRWGMIVNTIEGQKKTSWFNYYYYFILSRALGFILPKDITDFAVRTFWLKRKHNAKLTDAGISVILDRFFDFLIMVILLISVLPFWFGFFSLNNTIILIALIVPVAGVLLLLKFNLLFNFFQNMLLLIIKYLNKIPYIKFKHNPITSLPKFSKFTIFKLYLSSLCKMSFTMLRFLFFVYTINIYIRPEVILLGTPVGQLAYLFSFTPGGLGIFEAGWYGILKISSVNEQTILLFIVGQRALTYVFVIILAIIAQVIFFISKLNNKNWLTTSKE